MDKTLGVSHVISPSNIDGLIDVMKNSLVADVEKQKSAEVAAIKEETQTAVRKERAAREKAIREADGLRGQISIHDEEDKRTLEALIGEINHKIKIWTQVVRCAVGLLIFAIGFLPLLSDKLGGTAKIASLVIMGLVGATLAFFQVLDRPLRIQQRLTNRGIATAEKLAQKRGMAEKLLRFTIISTDGQLMLRRRHLPSDGNGLNLEDNE